MSDTTAKTKTEVLLDTCRKAKGATVDEIVEATGQTKQIVRSRLHTLGKRSLVAPIADSNPRRYKAEKKVAVKKKS
jgi:predicted ArsR family transcriptional regulator